ncbi:MAG: family 20 glycosylhydrolase, partial [Clostridia bacterium]|nr:family 20 glycosylhydrolase [Clostridia bacterium]
MRQNTFRRFGTMLDCSRGAVMTVETVKKWIDIISDLGYNTLMLYTEDTYEVEGQPYFGYLRGRYSVEELKSIDDYAFEHGVELIPCIQTLAHLEAIFRWSTYSDIRDCNDILLVDNAKTYELI